MLKYKMNSKCNINVMECTSALYEPMNKSEFNGICRMRNYPTNMLPM